MHLILSIWMKMRPFHIGDIIDARCRFGNWCKATIINYKSKHQPLANDFKLSKWGSLIKWDDRLTLGQMDAVLLNFEGWSDNYNEWIFLFDNYLCECHNQCRYSRNNNNKTNILWKCMKHRLTLPDNHTQSSIQIAANIKYRTGCISDQEIIKAAIKMEFYQNGIDIPITTVVNSL